MTLAAAYLAGVSLKIRGLLGVPEAGGGGSSGSLEGPEGPPEGPPGGPPGSPPGGGPGIPPGVPFVGGVGAPGGRAPGPGPGAPVLDGKTSGGGGSRTAPDSSEETLRHCLGAAALGRAPPAAVGAAAGNFAAAPQRSAPGDLQDGDPAPCPPPRSWSLSH
eukprot:9546589-Ditylum_brightwellii.AAC.1